MGSRPVISAALEAELKGLKTQGLLGLLSNFKASLNNLVRHCFKPESKQG